MNGWLRLQNPNLIALHFTVCWITCISICQTPVFTSTCNSSLQTVLYVGGHKNILPHVHVQAPPPLLDMQCSMKMVALLSWRGLRWRGEESYNSSKYSSPLYSSPSSMVAPWRSVMPQWPRWQTTGLMCCTVRYTCMYSIALRQFYCP